MHGVEALDAGESVLVAAPTGSGKTVVAEYAIERALDHGRKASTPRPLKASRTRSSATSSRRTAPVGSAC